MVGSSRVFGILRLPIGIVGKQDHDIQVGQTKFPFINIQYITERALKCDWGVHKLKSHAAELVHFGMTDKK